VKVFLVRHADADADIPEGLGDEARTLTSKSRAAIAVHFAALKDRLDAPDLMLTSPLSRCVQTSQILAHAIGYEGPLKSHRALLPDGPTGAIDALLREQLEKTLILVGHQPSMGSVTAHLLGMQTFPKPFSPGTVICLELAEPATPGAAFTGKLVFYATPGQPVLESLG
jgi:phosphohistidine phosphatase